MPKENLPDLCMLSKCLKPAFMYQLLCICIHLSLPPSVPQFIYLLCFGKGVWEGFFVCLFVCFLPLALPILI